ncbi:hypothetical protein ACWDG1_04200 [Streptomyces sp. NPDC001177]
MTAEHDKYDDGDVGMDALMAVLMDRPLPDGARADAALMAEHRAAVADVALLREQLGVIGDALAEPGEARKPVPAPMARAPRTPRPRAARFAFGAFAVVAVVAVLSGMAWLLTQTGNGMVHGASDSAGAKSDNSGGDAKGAYTACARLVVEGDVTSAERVPGTGKSRVTLRVTHYYKPAKGKAELTFLTDEAIDPAPRRGEHVLAGFLDNASSPDLWVSGKQEVADQRAVILRELALPTPASAAAGTCG